MISHRFFTRWFILFGAMMAGSTIAAHKGLVTLVLVSDVSYISAIIMGLFLIGSLLAGYVAHKMDEVDGRVNGSLNKHFAVLRFMADSFTSLGLLGTIVGFSVMMHGALVGTAEVSAIINQLKIGTSTALYTTLVGIVASLFLQLQTFVLKQSLNKNKP